MSEAVWLAEQGSYDGGGACAVLPNRKLAREWIEAAHEYKVADGREMERHEDEAEDRTGHRMWGEGWWLPTDIEELDDGEGWQFEATQGGAGHGHYRVRRVELPFYHRPASPDEMRDMAENRRATLHD